MVDELTISHMIFYLSTLEIFTSPWILNLIPFLKLVRFTWWGKWTTYWTGLGWTSTKLLHMIATTFTYRANSIAFTFVAKNAVPWHQMFIQLLLPIFHFEPGNSYVYKTLPSSQQSTFKCMQQLHDKTTTPPPQILQNKLRGMLFFYTLFKNFHH